MDIMNFATTPKESAEGFHGILYGPPGVGKTSTFDDPKLKVAIADGEGGSLPLKGAPNVTRWDVPEIAKQTGKHEFEVINELGEAVRSGKMKDFDMFVIDSLTWYQEVVKDYVAKRYAPTRRREIQDKFGAQSDWGDLMHLLTGAFRAFHTLTKRGEDSIHVFWTAHVMDVLDPVTEQPVSTKIALQGKQNPDIVMSIVDGFFYMYNRPVVEQVQDKSGKTVNKATGEIERGILTRPTGIYNSKSRVPKRMEPLPNKIVNPVWSEVFEMMGYGKGNE